MMLQIAFIPIVLLISILFFVLWVVMLVDAATRKFKDSSEKIIWVIVVIFAGFIGALIYYFVIYKNFKSLKWFWITLLILAVIFIVLILLIFFYSSVSMVRPQPLASYP